MFMISARLSSDQLPTYSAIVESISASREKQFVIRIFRAICLQILLKECQFPDVRSNWHLGKNGDDGDLFSFEMVLRLPRGCVESLSLLGMGVHGGSMFWGVVRHVAGK
ncbi:hypothetical protein Tco_1438222 [Tanacetum coccineum]